MLCRVTLTKNNRAFYLWGRAAGYKSHESAESRGDAIIFSLQSHSVQSEKQSPLYDSNVLQISIEMRSGRENQLR